MPIVLQVGYSQRYIHHFFIMVLRSIYNLYLQVYGTVYLLSAREITFLAASSNPSNACRGSPLSAIYPIILVSSERLHENQEHSITGTHHFLTKFLISPTQPHHNRHLHIQIPECHDDTLRDHVAACQTAEDIDKDSLDAWIRADNLEGRLDGLGCGFTTGIEEVGAVPAVDGEGVDCVHGKSRAVH